MRTIPTEEQILRVAQTLVRSRGFHGFEIADIAKEMGITIADVRAHFQSKTELGHRMVDQIQRAFTRIMSEIHAAKPTGLDRLRSYAALFAWSDDFEERCLFGVLAAEVETLPQVMQLGISRHFEQHRVWMSAVLSSGRTDGSLKFVGEPESHARTLTASFLGALIVTKIQGSAGQFAAISSLSIDRYRSQDVGLFQI